MWADASDGQYRGTLAVGIGADNRILAAVVNVDSPEGQKGLLGWTSRDLTEHFGVTYADLFGQPFSPGRYPSDHRSSATGDRMLKLLLDSIRTRVPQEQIIEVKRFKDAAVLAFTFREKARGSVVLVSGHEPPLRIPLSSDVAGLHTGDHAAAPWRRIVVEWLSRDSGTNLPSLIWPVEGAPKLLANRSAVANCAGGECVSVPAVDSLWLLSNSQSTTLGKDVATALLHVTSGVKPSEPAQILTFSAASYGQQAIVGLREPTPGVNEIRLALRSGKQGPFVCFIVPYASYVKTLEADDQTPACKGNRVGEARKTAARIKDVKGVEQRELLMGISRPASESPTCTHAYVIARRLAGAGTQCHE